MDVDLAKMTMDLFACSLSHFTPFFCNNAHVLD